MFYRSSDVLLGHLVFAIGIRLDPDYIFGWFLVVQRYPYVFFRVSSCVFELVGAYPVIIASHILCTSDFYACYERSTVGQCECEVGGTGFVRVFRDKFEGVRSETHYVDCEVGVDRRYGSRNLFDTILLLCPRSLILDFEVEVL